MAFLRRDNTRFSRLGKRRKKKQTWRRPTGRDNKMRERRRGYPSRVSIGYKKPDEKKKIIVNNVKELANIGKDVIVVIGSVGKKKKIEIANKAKEMKLSLSNLNAQSFLKKVEKAKKLKKSKEPKKDEKKKDEKPKEEKKTKNESKEDKK